MSQQFFLDSPQKKASMGAQGFLFYGWTVLLLLYNAQDFA